MPGIAQKILTPSIPLSKIAQNAISERGKDRAVDLACF